MFQLQLFFLLHCDEWDRVVALPRHKFVTGATLLQLVVPLLYCRILTILHIYHRQPVPKTDCQLSRRFILDYLGLQHVF
jgi:hypothetical protein